MSKNITIQEGGVAKQMTVDKLKTNLVGGGTCLWLPEDEVLLGQKTINANGTYKASDDGLYGYSQVTVSNAGIASGTIPSGATLPTGDGNEYSVTTDNNGNLDFFKVPSSIQITTQPTTTEYHDGDDIDFTGMVVKAYNADGTLWTDSLHPDGIIPISELTLPVTVADMQDGNGQHYSDGAGVTALQLIFTARYWEGHNNLGAFVTGVTYCDDVVLGTWQGKDATLAGHDLGSVLLTTYGGKVYVKGLSGDTHLNHAAYFTGPGSGGESFGVSDMVGWHHYIWTQATAPMNQFADMDEHLNDLADNLPESTADPTRAGEMHLVDARQSVPVQYVRPHDLKVLETSFDVAVTGASIGTSMGEAASGGGQTSGGGAGRND